MTKVSVKLENDRIKGFVFSVAKLPQTGQPWWPVPVLLAAGLVLVIIGLVRRRGDDYEER